MEAWIRMNYVQDNETMQKSIAVIADEIEKAYQEAKH